MCKIKKLLLTLSLLLSVVCANAQDENFYIFLCIGQSNMVGQAEITSEDKNVDERFMSMSAVDGKDGRKIGKWRKAVPPICRQDTKLGFVDFFGREMLNSLPAGSKVGVVSVAVDGTAIDLFDKDACKAYINSVTEDWKKREIAAYGNNPYERLIEVAQIAQEDGEIRGILLHQGETDAYIDAWLKKVKKVYYDIVNDLELDSTRCPLILGEVVRSEYGGACAHANPTINKMPKVLQHAYVVSAAGCPPCSDNVHFSRDGYRQLGINYAEKTLQAMGLELVRAGRTETTTHVVRPAYRPEGSAPLDITASLDNNNILKAHADVPLKELEIASYSGKSLGKIDLDGKDAVEIDVTEYFKKDDNLVFAFRSVNGLSRSFTMTADTNQPEVNVKASLSSEDVLEAEADQPITSVDIQTLEGTVLETIKIKNKTEVNVDLSRWSSIPIRVVFNAANGASSSYKFSAKPE